MPRVRPFAAVRAVVALRTVARPAVHELGIVGLLEADAAAAALVAAVAAIIARMGSRIGRGEGGRVERSRCRRGCSRRAFRR
jgi:hypothetical protein